MIPSELPPALIQIVDHLWQSTLFVIAVGPLTLALKKNRAHVRYCVWLAASIKFLVPFSILVALGSYLQQHTSTKTTASSPVPLIVEVSQPFTSKVAIAGPRPQQSPFESWIPSILAALWAVGFIAVAASWWSRWRLVGTALRTAQPLNLPVGVKVVSSPTFVEPGVFGVFRPVLVLPEGINERLTAAQLEAILAHELCHVRRRDNLAAVVHMVVEALFWFHPLVWWLGARLIEERERACDEEVLRMGSEPAIYAEGMLKICELYLESPLQCVAGVTGADLKKRIEAIMENRSLVGLSAGKKAALAVAGVAVLAVPIAVGVASAPVLRAQSVGGTVSRFEVASIRRCEGGPGALKSKSDKGAVERREISHGRLTLSCMTAAEYIRWAYFTSWSRRLKPELSPISGGPAWINSERYTIQAKAEEGTSPEVMQGPMLQSLLEERFKARIRRETRQVPVYALTVTKGGFKAERFEDGLCRLRDPNDLTAMTPSTPGEKPFCVQLLLKDRSNSVIKAEGATLDEFSQLLAFAFNRPVADRTGLQGRFNLRLEYAPDESTPEFGPNALVPTPDPVGGPSIFTAVQEQLGLKLDSSKGPGQALVIEHIERPSEN